MKIFEKKNLFLDETGLQDVIFLVGIFIFVSILIIGFFPDRNTANVINQDFFTYIVMLVPVIAAVYFIIISFRRNLYLESAEIGVSIRKKMTIAFVAIAILPTLAILITSNHLINKTLSNLIFDKTSASFEEAIETSRGNIKKMNNDIYGNLDTIDYLVSGGMININNRQGRERIRKINSLKNSNTVFFSIINKGDLNNIDYVDQIDKKCEKEFYDFYKYADLKKIKRVDRISIKGRNYISGSLLINSYLVVNYSPVPERLNERIELFESSLADYNKLASLKTFIKNDTQVFLLSLSILIVIISVLLSLYLSKSITRPVLELSDAAKQIAGGNFNVDIHRESEDELGILFDSFNKMVKELDQNRKLMYQKQKLEAWKEMAKRVVHEIKNPLTPIRLSAERMRRRFIEKHSEIEEIILSGTETIIEEVEVLMNILSEFTKFARLPEMKPEKMELNPFLGNCINFFSGHENISFELDMEENLPEIKIDKVLIWQALTNLIQNAVDSIKEKEKGVIKLKSSLLFPGGLAYIRIEIIDTGIGIKKSDLDRIFEPGFSTKPSGTGLGLAIVEKIIIEHSGILYCKSKPGEGTNFIIELPVEINDEEEVYG